MDKRWLAFGGLAAIAITALVAACSSDSPVAPSPTPVTPAAVAEVVRSNARALRTLDPDDADFTDLTDFGRAVGERSMVILGEPTHGDGDIFKLKTRLVRYLHEAKGFDVLIMESGMFDVARMNERLASEGKTFSALAPGRVFYMYSKTADAQRVLQYVDASRATTRPMQFMGFDITMGGDASVHELLPMLSTLLASRGSVIPASADFAVYQRVARQAVALTAAPTPDAASLAAFKRISAALDGELCATQAEDFAFTHSPSFWCRIVRSVDAGTEHLWGPVDLRDITGGDNIRWLMDHRFAGKKVVLWMHSFHGTNGQALPPSGPTWKSVGTRLVEHFGDQVFMAHFTVGQGSFDNYIVAHAPSVPPLVPSMLEFHLAATKAPQFMAWPNDSAQQHVLRSVSVFEPDIHASRPHHFGTGYQGLFFIPQTRPVLQDDAAFPFVP